MGIRTLISGFSLAALVAAGIAVPTVVHAGDVKINLHGHFIGHNYGIKHHYGNRPRRHNYGNYYSFPRHRYGHSYSYGRKHYYGYTNWYGRKHQYGYRSYGKHRPQRLDRRHRKQFRRHTQRGFSDVVNPQPRRKRR